jgi:hypothetical protein
MPLSQILDLSGPNLTGADAAHTRRIGFLDGEVVTCGYVARETFEMEGMSTWACH